MSNDFDRMSKNELESELRRLKDDLEDLEETVSFYFANTAAHIPGSSVKRVEEEREELKTKIEEVEKLLSGT